MVARHGDDLARRQLKTWALAGMTLTDKKSHFDEWAEVLRIPESELKSQEELDAMAPAAWPAEFLEVAEGRRGHGRGRGRGRGGGAKRPRL